MPTWTTYQFTPTDPANGEPTGMERLQVAREEKPDLFQGIELTSEVGTGKDGEPQLIPVLRDADPLVQDAAGAPTPPPPDATRERERASTAFDANSAIRELISTPSLSQRAQKFNQYATQLKQRQASIEDQYESLYREKYGLPGIEQELERVRRAEQAVWEENPEMFGTRSSHRVKLEEQLVQRQIAVRNAVSSELGRDVRYSELDTSAKLLANSFSQQQGPSAKAQLAYSALTPDRQKAVRQYTGHENNPEAAALSMQELTNEEHLVLTTENSSLLLQSLTRPVTAKAAEARLSSLTSGSSQILEQQINRVKSWASDENSFKEAMKNLGFNKAERDQILGATYTNASPDEKAAVRAQVIPTLLRRESRQAMLEGLRSSSTLLEKYAKESESIGDLASMYIGSKVEEASAAKDFAPELVPDIVRDARNELMPELVQANRAMSTAIVAPYTQAELRVTLEAAAKAAIAPKSASVLDRIGDTVTNYSSAFLETPEVQNVITPYRKAWEYFTESGE